jgi:hypothetical protein
MQVGYLLENPISHCNSHGTCVNNHSFIEHKYFFFNKNRPATVWKMITTIKGSCLLNREATLKQAITHEGPKVEIENKGY